jgi:hypothetical protein
MSPGEAQMMLLHLVTHGMGRVFFLEAHSNVAPQDWFGYARLFCG